MRLIGLAALIVLVLVTVVADAQQSAIPRIGFLGHGDSAAADDKQLIGVPSGSAGPGLDRGPDRGDRISVGGRPSPAP